MNELDLAVSCVKAYQNDSDMFRLVIYIGFPLCFVAGMIFREILFNQKSKA